MKLNFRNTFLVGLAFMSIISFWQLYDNIVPLLLTNPFHMNETLSGVIMAADNVLALFLLPFFGKLSDKTSTKIGKRMPYILVGTLVAAVLLVLLPIIDNGAAAGKAGFFYTLPMFVIILGLMLFTMSVYRSPAVALMPDITPKPLRAKANGIINIMGYIGGAFATVLGMIPFIKLSNYIGTPLTDRNLWTVEIPFLVASVLMVISALVLFATIKENKLEEELKTGSMCRAE